MSLLRSKSLALYKNLLYYGREYPAGYDFFRIRLNRAFKKQQHLTDPAEIAKKHEHGEFIIKELEALYMLKKYRYLKRNYYDTVEEENKKIGLQATANATATSKAKKSLLQTYSETKP